MVTQANKFSLSGGVWFLISLLVLYCLYSQYPLLAIYGAITLIIIIKTVWRLYQPAVLLFWFLYQWLQVVGALWYADLFESGFRSVFRTDSGELAVFLSLTGINLQVLIIAWVIRNQKNYTIEALKSAAEALNVNRIIVLYIISAILFPLIYKIAININELTQVILVLAKVKQIFVIMLVFMLFLRTEGKSMIILILVLEFLSGFLTYFSTFKDVLLLCLICYLSFIKQLKLSTIMKVLPFVVILFFLMVFWSAVKGRYRMFVNEGTRTQQVQVENSEAFKKIFDLATDFKEKDFNQGLMALMFRIQYIHFFSRVIDRVPEVMPYEEGALFFSSLRFVLVPRALDPDKGVHDVSIKTSKYAGMRVAGLSKGTSMAIGSYGDAFIDFGPVGMMIPLMVIAFLLGWFYRFLMTRKFNLVLVYSITIAFISTIGFFESDTVILLGNIKNGFLVNLLMIVTVYPWIGRFITHKTANVKKNHSIPVPTI